MKTTSTTSNILFSLFAGAILATTALTAQTVLIQDNFTLAATRTQGTALHNTAPETSYLPDNKWNVTAAQGATVFSSNGTIISSANNSSNEARIAIPAPATTDYITVSASIIPATTDWFAIGFLSNTTTGTFMTDGKAWVALKSSGNVTAYQNGTGGNWSGSNWTTRFETMLGGSFDATQAYTVKLQLRLSDGKFKVWIGNGTTEISLYEHSAGTPDGWIPSSVQASSIGAVGFRINGKTGTTAGTASIDNFKVETSATLAPLTPSIPEPANIALLAGLGTLLALITFKMRRT